MKKVSIFICCLLLVFGLIACGSIDVNGEVAKASPIKEPTSDRFIVSDSILLEDYRNANTYASIYVDKETGVQYIFMSSGYRGGLCVLVDSDGKPLLYEGLNKREE